MPVGCAAIWFHLVVQLYGGSWLWNYMVSIGCVAIWYRLFSYMVLVVQLYGVGCAAIWKYWLWKYMVSIGCVVI